MNGIVYKSLRLSRNEARDIGRETEWLAKPASAFSTDDGAAWPRKPILLSRWEADHLGRAAEWVSAATPEEKLLADLFPHQRAVIDALRPGSTLKPEEKLPADLFPQRLERRVRWHPIGNTLANPLAADRRKIPHAYPPGKIGRDDWSDLEDIFAGKARALGESRDTLGPVDVDVTTTTPRSDGEGKEFDFAEHLAGLRENLRQKRENHLLNMSDPWVTSADIAEAAVKLFYDDAALIERAVNALDLPVLKAGDTLVLDAKVTRIHDEVTVQVEVKVTPA